VGKAGFGDLTKHRPADSADAEYLRMIGLGSEIVYE